MHNLNKQTTVDAVADHQRFEENPVVNDIPQVTASAWFAKGTRVSYDPSARKILQQDDETDPAKIIQVFKRIEKEAMHDDGEVWTSFLPGWPDGSYGWAKVDQYLVGKDIGPRLFLDYIGHGDSDKPRDYAYNTDERADLIEAMWQAEGIQSTFLVCFDYSSIAALELLSRQLDRREKGLEQIAEIKGVLLMNGGLFAEAHTHPFLTTPILKSFVGKMVTPIAQRSKAIFRELMMELWSKDYVVTKAETDELHAAISRRDGMFILHNSADFVDHHKRNSKRLNLERLFHAFRDTVSFHVVGSEQDQIEGQQPHMAQERLGDYDLDIRILPGGHLATSEQPYLLAQIIQEVVAKEKHLNVSEGNNQYVPEGMTFSATTRKQAS